MRSCIECAEQEGVLEEFYGEIAGGLVSSSWNRNGS